MKRILTLVCVTVLLLTGCTSHHRTDITREEIFAVYEAAGYEVSSRVYDEKLDTGAVAYVQADHPNGEYIYFSIFETEEDARQYKKEFYHPGMMWLFTVIYGDPSWQHSEVYGRILVQYDDENHFHPFESLLTKNEP